METSDTNAGNNRNQTGSAEVNPESGSVVGRRRFLQTAGAGAAVAVAGCSGGGGDDGPVRLGATYILSGFASLYGEAAERGIEMATTEINDDGGIDGRDVEVITRDTEASADTAIQQMRSLVEEDNVHGLFGLDSSGVAQAVAPQAAQLQMPFMITHAATSFVTSPEGEHEDSVGNDYVFRDSNNITQNVYGAARVASELDATEWATIGPDYAFGYETWDYFQDFCTGLGVDAEFTAEQFPPLATGDYTPYISSILDAEPDAVITPLWGADLTTFIGQAEEAGWFDQIDNTLFSVGMGTDLASDGNPLPEGEYSSTRYDPFVPDSEANNFPTARRTTRSATRTTRSTARSRRTTPRARTAPSTCTRKRSSPPGELTPTRCATRSAGWSTPDRSATTGSARRTRRRSRPSGAPFRTTRSGRATCSTP